MAQSILYFLKMRFPIIYKLKSRVINPTSPIPLGLWLLNWIVQRLFRINANTPWMVHFTSVVTSAHRIKIAADVKISFAVSGGCYFQGGNGIEIGKGTIIAPGVKIISANHDPVDFSRHIPSPPIKIGEHCWLGANCVILPGVILHDNCIVGAGAVVTHSFPAGSVIVGVPGTRINE